MEEKQDNGYDEILKTLESKSFRASTINATLGFGLLYFITVDSALPYFIPQTTVGLSANIIGFLTFLGIPSLSTMALVIAQETDKKLGVQSLKFDICLLLIGFLTSLATCIAWAIKFI